jgi:hypothetical protein
MIGASNSTGIAGATHANGPSSPGYQNLHHLRSNSFSSSPTASSMSSTSSVASSPTVVAATMSNLEKLHALLKQKEGEVVALQLQVTALEKSKGTQNYCFLHPVLISFLALLQDELVNLTSKNEALYPPPIVICVILFLL